MNGLQDWHILYFLSFGLNISLFAMFATEHDGKIRIAMLVYFLGSILSIIIRLFLTGLTALEVATINQIGIIPHLISAIIANIIFGSYKIKNNK